MGQLIEDLPMEFCETIVPRELEGLSYLAASGFPLSGGRLGYVNSHSATALIYRRHKHVINVFLWPETRTTNISPAMRSSKRGYNLEHWIQSGMAFWVVFDLNPTELNEFSRKLQQAQSQ